MGITLVGKVLARWTSVPHNAFRVLVQMAMTALDEPSDGRPPNLYFAGHEPLMLVIPSDPKASFESRDRAVQRAVADLVAMGAICRTNKARSGSRQVYLLTLDNAVRAIERKADKRWGIDKPLVDNSGQGDTVRHPQPDTVSHPEGDTVRRESPTPFVTPRNHEEGLEEKLKEENDLRGPVTLARADAPNEDGFIPIAQCGYDGCSMGWIIPADPMANNEPCPNCNSNVIPFPDRRTA